MKPIKLKELLRTAKDPATQRIVIDEGLWFDAPLFEGVVKDVDEALGERMTKVSVRFVTTKVNSEYGKLALATAKYLAFCER